MCGDATTIRSCHRCATARVPPVSQGGWCRPFAPPESAPRSPSRKPRRSAASPISRAAPSPTCAEQRQVGIGERRRRWRQRADVRALLSRRQRRGDRAKARLAQLDFCGRLLAGRRWANDHRERSQARIGGMADTAHHPPVNSLPALCGGPWRALNHTPWLDRDRRRFTRLLRPFPPKQDQRRHHRGADE